MTSAAPVSKQFMVVAGAESRQNSTSPAPAAKIPTQASGEIVAATTHAPATLAVASHLAARHPYAKGIVHL